MSLEISTQGIEEQLRRFAHMPEVAEEAARIAVNDTAALARRTGKKEIQKQVALKSSYLDENLKVTKFATNADLEATVSGRERPVSLARYALGAPRFGKQGGKSVKVKVAGDGSTKEIPSAFYIKLRSGKTLDADNFNVGLAVRLKPGERIANKRRMVSFGGGLYLLYGPSVAQVFDDVAVEIEPVLSAHMVAEFVRQFERLDK